MSMYPLAFLMLSMSVPVDDGVAASEPPSVSGPKAELATSEEPFFEFRWLEAYLAGTGATGDWYGLRTDLERAGVTVAGSAITEWSWVPPGEGVADRWGFRYLVNLGVDVDLERLADWRGGQVFVDFEWADTGVDGGRSGSPSGYSDIAVAERVLELSEFWWDQRIDDGPWRIKIGKIDANEDFAAIPVTGDFVASSAALPTTIFAMPTYPSPALGASVFLDPADDWHFGFAVFDGSGASGGVRTGGATAASVYDNEVKGDVFLIANGVYRSPDLLGDDLTGRFEFGGWWNSGPFETFGGSTRQGTGGIWANASIRCWAPTDVKATDDTDLAGLWWFGQYGWTPGDVSEVESEWGVGLVQNGTFPGRSNDAAGLYVTGTGSSSDAASGFDGRWETLLEGYYAAAVTPWLTIQPDVQFVVDPGADPAIPDTWVLTLRLTVDF